MHWERLSARFPQRYSGRLRSPSETMRRAGRKKGAAAMMKELTYTKQGEYYLPNLTLGETEEQPLGKYGMMRRSFLQENKPILYNDLILKGKLFDHLREIEETANRRLEQMMKEKIGKET